LHGVALPRILCDRMVGGAAAAGGPASAWGASLDEVVVDRARERRRERAAGSRTRRSTSVVAVLLTVLSLLGWAGDARAADASVVRARGWEYLVEKLVADGVDRRRVLRAFSDPRVEPFTGLEFGLRPREPSSLYRGFTRPASIALARRCRATHDPALRAAEREHGVPASVVAAIIHIESGCGRNTGSEVVLWRLARLAMANEPANLHDNIRRHAIGARSPDSVERLTRERAQYLEDTFYPEVLATFQIADKLDIDPLGIRGSGSGAFGMPQFLPRSYLSYAVDGNGDGRITLYDADDAIASCANYLAAHGWRPGLSRAERRRVIWHYNRSDAYIDAVLALAERLDGPVPRTQTAKAKPARAKAKPKPKVAKKSGAARTAN
jgi:membrane-bound lytic murein transglycosylase B